MVQAKKMSEEAFAKLHKNLVTTGELIRARQEEKQGLLDEFTAESKRFFFGRISEKSLVASVKKTNKELMRLDKGIRDAISKSKKLSDSVKVLAGKQQPIAYKATLSGISGGAKKKKKAKKKAKKKVVKRKVVKRKVVKRKVVKKKAVKKKASKKKTSKKKKAKKKKR